MVCKVIFVSNPTSVQNIQVSARHYNSNHCVSSLSNHSLVSVTGPAGVTGDRPGSARKRSRCDDELEKKEEEEQLVCRKRKKTFEQGGLVTRRRSLFESLGGCVRQETCGRGLMKDQDQQNHDVFQGENVGGGLEKGEYRIPIGGTSLGTWKGYSICQHD